MPDIVDFQPQELPGICDQLSEREPVFHRIMEQFGYPPFWSRPLDFPHLLLIILEQQVSLASAKATFNKLIARIPSLSPSSFIHLSAEELRNIGFSRQKTTYGRALARAILEEKIVLETLPSLPDEEVKNQLIQIKGIGRWTAEVVLMMMLHRADVFPIGDLALRNSMKAAFGLPRETSPSDLEKMAEDWKPYRSIATFLFWHRYLSVRKKK